MGQATSRDKCLLLCLRSGQARAVEFDIWTRLVGDLVAGADMSGRVQSGPVWSGWVRVVECGLY